MGRGFGAVLLSQESRIGITAPEASDWLSDVAMKCKTTTASIARTKSAEVTVGSRRGMITKTASYDVAIVSSLLQPNQPATGSARVTVYGLGLATVDMSTVDRLGATGCEGTEWSSNTAIMCLAASISIRANTNRDIRTVGEQSSSMLEAYSADVGSLSAVSRSNVAAAGLASVTMHGAGLGQVALTAMGRRGQTGCEGTEWKSDTSVRCMMGHGARHRHDGWRA